MSVHVFVDMAGFFILNRSLWTAIGRAGSVNEAAGGETDKPACLSGVDGILCRLRIHSSGANLRCNTVDHTGDTTNVSRKTEKEARKSEEKTLTLGNP